MAQTANATRHDSHAPTRRRRGPLAKGVAVSLLVHAGIASAILGAAWGVAVVSKSADTRAPIVLVADFADPAPAPPREPDRPSTASSPAAAIEPAIATDELAARLRALEQTSDAANPALDAIARRFGALSPAGEGAGETEAPIVGRGASFAGLVAGTATSVAYVVDASGSMAGSFPAIVDEVARSLARLDPSQRFTVVCFRRDGAVALGGDGALRPATADATREAVRWLREGVVPSGRSSPLEALRVALRSGADCVFLLSTTVTGPGRHELDRAALLEAMEALNPRDPRSGARRATIQCIQFLEEDPGGALSALADAHFGAGGYRFISRGDAGFDGGGFDEPRVDEAEFEGSRDAQGNSP
ncbi:MAG: hypothetical protein GC172_11180 [Phycisphaera sp.]|nr:hypothetical protein [Phycisphaera sp.]